MSSAYILYHLMPLAHRLSWIAFIVSECSCLAVEPGV